MPSRHDNDKSAMNLIVWLVQYLGLPLSCVIIIYRLFSGSKLKLEKLKGKVVFISGASSGVGEALAHCFYSCGCRVVLAARRERELERVKNDLLLKNVDKTTYEPIVLYLDLAKIDSLESVIQKVENLCGHIDILINNGGVSSRGNVLDTNIDVHTKLMYVNHFGPIVLSKAALPKMIERKTGHIVFVSSVQGRMALPDRSAYSASKHASQAFADSLRAEVSKHNINVSVISPGYIQTALSTNALTGSGDQYGVTDSTTASGYKAEYVAEKILDMVVNKSNELILSPISPKFAILLRYLLPDLYFWIMSNRAKY